MNSEDSKKEIQTASALYALGALPEPEAHAFEAILSENKNGEAEEFAGFAVVVSYLGLSVNQITPPPSLRTKLLAQISSDSKQ